MNYIRAINKLACSSPHAATLIAVASVVCACVCVSASVCTTPHVRETMPKIAPAPTSQLASPGSGKVAGPSSPGGEKLGRNRYTETLPRCVVDTVIAFDGGETAFQRHGLGQSVLGIIDISGFTALTEKYAHDKVIPTPPLSLSVVCLCLSASTCLSHSYPRLCICLHRPVFPCQ